MREERDQFFQMLNDEYPEPIVLEEIKIGDKKV